MAVSAPLSQTFLDVGPSRQAQTSQLLLDLRPFPPPFKLTLNAVLTQKTAIILPHSLEPFRKGLFLSRHRPQRVVLARSGTRISILPGTSPTSSLQVLKFLYETESSRRLLFTPMWNNLPKFRSVLLSPSCITLSMLTTSAVLSPVLADSVKGQMEATITRMKVQSS